MQGMVLRLSPKLNVGPVVRRQAFGAAPERNGPIGPVTRCDDPEVRWPSAAAAFAVGIPQRLRAVADRDIALVVTPPHTALGRSSDRHIAALSFGRDGANSWSAAPALGAWPGNRPKIAIVDLDSRFKAWQCDGQELANCFFAGSGCADAPWSDPP